METIGGDSNKMGLVMKKWKKNLQLISVPTSPQTTGKRRRATTTSLVGDWVQHTVRVTGNLSNLLL